MKKFKYLLANGCSFTLGSCMYDVETFIDQTEKREKFINSNNLITC